MKKIELKQRAYSVEDLRRLIKNNELTIQPKYQRRRTTWPIMAKTSLLDTLLNNYPIPPIYLREYITEGRERKREIIDGQQRISTILEFIDNKYSLAKNFTESEFQGNKFSELPFGMQQEILDYELSFFVIKQATESDIISIFSRLNSFTLPLNKQEKRNANYSGQFKTLVYKLSSLYSSFWSEFKIFTDRGISRMKEAQFISEIFTTLEYGFSNYSGKKINQAYTEFDEKFSNYRNYSASFNFIMSLMGHLLDTPELKSNFRRHAWFFTLFIVLFEKAYFVPGATSKNFKHKSLNLDAIREKLISFVTDYKADNVSEEIVLKYRQGTGTGSNRLDRHKHMLSIIA